jgi:hypothetical protein
MQRGEVRQRRTVEDLLDPLETWLRFAERARLAHGRSQGLDDVALFRQRLASRVRHILGRHNALVVAALVQPLVARFVGLNELGDLRKRETSAPSSMWN